MQERLVDLWERYGALFLGGIGAALLFLAAEAVSGADFPEVNTIVILVGAVPILIAAFV